MDNKNNIMDTYKNILIINLQHRTDRLLNIYNQLDSIGLADTTIRIKAIDKNEALKHINMLSPEVCTNINDIYSTSIIPNFSAFGCALSHMKCWKHIIDNNLEDGIILEDDIKIVDPVLFRLDLIKVNHYISESETSDPIILLFNPDFSINMNINDMYNAEYRYYNSHNINNNNNIYQIISPFTNTSMYYINRHMAKYLLEKITTLTYQIDIELGYISSRCPNNIAFYGYNTTNLTTNMMGTDIQTYLISIAILEQTITQCIDMPKELINIIYDYIPAIFKKK